eukprot:TRINITY_DN1549_c0_g1_i5.p1 TRINITY_DN1549_c0_g1~~TRINITY_DN1549_c0_g1_i5.p1  ORF type:complete len:304 (+),score=33.27 TRINITY_DN1549_c0_g1_i5:2252-3163(+)
MNSDDIDLVEVGLASLRQITPEKNLCRIKINEPLSIEVIKELLLEGHNAMKDIVSYLMDKCQGDEGLSKVHFEYLVVCCLKWVTVKNPTVAEFARKFGISDSDLEQVPWTKRAHITIPSIASLHSLGYRKEPEVLEDFLSKMEKNTNTETTTTGTSSPIFVRLDHMMRPDALQLKQISDTEYYSILLSTKLYNGDGVPSHLVSKDLNSTDFKKLYYNTNGETVNNKKKEDHEWWQSILQHHPNCKHVGSLRVHILLPRIQGYNQPQSRVEGEDVILYVNSSNLGTIFDIDAQKLLDIACKPIN